MQKAALTGALCSRNLSEHADPQRAPLQALESSLAGLPDLERGLMRILHCTRSVHDKRRADSSELYAAIAAALGVFRIVQAGALPGRTQHSPSPLGC